MNASPRKIDPEWVVAIAAVVISLCALVVSAFQTQLMKQQAAYMVWPHLQVYNSNIEGLQLNIVNKGVGPAIVESVTYSFDGQPAKSIRDLIDLIKKADSTVAPDSVFHFRYADIGSIIVGANDEHLLLDVKYPEANIIHRVFKKIGFQLCYRSIQQEYWHIDGVISAPEPGCP